MMKNRLYEHLITKHKYSKLKIRLDVLREELQNKSVELNTERQLYKKRKEVWEAKLKEQEEEIIDLKKKITDLKKKLKKDEK